MACRPAWTVTWSTRTVWQWCSPVPWHRAKASAAPTIARQRLAPATQLVGHRGILVRQAPLQGSFALGALDPFGSTKPALPRRRAWGQGCRRSEGASVLRKKRRMRKKPPSDGARRAAAHRFLRFFRFFRFFRVRAASGRGRGGPGSPGATFQVPAGRLAVRSGASGDVGARTPSQPDLPRPGLRRSASYACRRSAPDCRTAISAGYVRQGGGIWCR